MPRWAAKRDTTERPIVQALRKAGALVMILDRFDLLVLYRGQLFMMDAKTRRGRKARTTASQDGLIRDGWPLWYVQSEIDALRVIGAVR